MSKKTSKFNNTQHTYTDEELESTKNFINSRLQDDPECAYLLPIDDPDPEIFQKCKDGVLLSKIINVAVPDTIDPRVINLPKKKELNRWQITENHNLLLNSAKGIGCKITNIGTDDIYEESPYLILGLLWQIIKIGLMKHINLKEHPELIRLLEEGETLEDFLALPPEQILLRWFNYQLKQANEPRRVKNFGGDIKDSHCYTMLLKQIGGGKCDTSPLSEDDAKKRADKMLDQADKLGCREYVTPIDVVRGNNQLNFCFVANLFNEYPCLEEVDPADYADLLDFDSEGSREERAFRYWMQSLGFDVNNLYMDLRDGLILLKLIDMIKPKTVNWKKVCKKPKNKFQAVGNTNMVVNHCKNDLGLSLVGIGGVDLYDGNKKLTLAVVWQLMRAHVLHLLEKVGGGKKITESELIAWANDKVKSCDPIKNFKDKSLGTGKYVCYLCYAVSPRSCNTELISDGDNEEDALQNAKYAISVSRKIGAVVFTLPEDITEVKDKMILTFFASLMYVSQGGKFE